MEAEFYAEYFEAEDRHWWFVGRRQIILRALERQLPPPSTNPRKILDVGSGTGAMLGHLRRFGEVQGVDPDEAAVAFCHQRGEGAVQQLPDPELPFPEGAFDLVTAFDVLEHIDDDRSMLAEIRRVLGPGGTFVASVPAYRWLWGPQDEISHHKRRYHAAQLVERLGTAGFALTHISYFNTLLFPAIAAIRLLRPYRPGAAELKSDFELTPPGRVNSALAALFSLEAGLVARARLPFGVSILVIATPQRRTRTPGRC